METQEVKEKIYTFCSSCGRICKGKISGRFVLCDICQKWTPTGSNSFYKIKGGDDMTAKKTVKKVEKAIKTSAKSVAKAESGNVVNKKQLYIEGSQKVKDFMDSTFKDVSKEDKLKINNFYWKLLKAE